jgi:hypothetical protein
MNDYRFLAALQGRSAELTSAESVDEALKAFAPGGGRYDAWMAGDAKAIAEHIALNNRKHPGTVEID